MSQTNELFMCAMTFPDEKTSGIAYDEIKTICMVGPHQNVSASRFIDPRTGEYWIITFGMDPNPGVIETIDRVFGGQNLIKKLPPGTIELFVERYKQQRTTDPSRIHKHYPGGQIVGGRGGA